MMLISLLVYFIGLLLLAFLCFCFYLYYLDWKQCEYFKQRGIPYIKADYVQLVKLLAGKTTLVDAEINLYREALKTKSPCVGVSDFLGRLYMITDLDLTKSIYVKDSDHFIDRRKLTTQNVDKIMSKMLISLEGDQWKGMRSKLSPTFTTGKIKRMFAIFEQSSQRMCHFVEKNKGESGDIDICKAYSKYAIDVIASCAFGINCKTFDCEPGKMSEFEKMAAELTFKLTIKTFFKFITISAAPRLAELLGFRTFANEAQDYFERVIKEALKHRRKTGQRHDDFLQLMLDAQQGLLKTEENLKETIEVMTGTSEEKSGNSPAKGFADSSKNFKIDDDDIVANCVLFLIGGFDTTQSVLIFTAYQLALEQECQNKLRQEVNEAFKANNGKLTYEAVHGMSYLDMFINETLRYRPPAARTERQCTKDYQIPNGPLIEKGSLIGLPVLGTHRNPDYYENPEKFDPERFLPERKGKMHPYSFAPFGHGPRNCIGMRFALTEVKTVIATLVHKFKFEPCSKTDIPVKLSNSTTPKPINGMWLNLQYISEE